MRRSSIIIGGVALWACALAILGEGDAEAGVHDAGARDAPADAGWGGQRADIPPDPPALVERHQWMFDLRWRRGDIYLLEIRDVDLGSPRPTPRVMGRFAIELYEGPTLIERARFDFPMLGVPDGADAGLKTPPRLEPGLTTRIGVLFPRTRRGTRLELWDRATDRRWPLPWPPREGVYSPATGASRDAAAD